MFDLIIYWGIGVLTCGSVLKIWFDTTFICLLFKGLKAAGFKKGDTNYWNVDPIVWRYWLRFQWKSWAEQDKMPHWLHHLWNCPGCFSFHVGFWVSLTLAILTREWWLFPIGTATYVWSGLWVFQKISNTSMATAYQLKQKETQWLSK